MRKISASEIGTFLFCERAWWYHHQGIESHNLEELAGGSELHHRHSQAVFASGFLRVIASIVILAGIVLLAIFLILQIV